MAKKKSSLKSGRVARVTRLGGLAARLAGGAAAAGGRVLTRGREAAGAAFHEKTARKLLDTLGSMKGLPMKVGQILSYMDGVIPPEAEPIYREALERLQVRSDPMTWDELAPVVEEDLGRPPEELFDDIDIEPLAAASIGQVHGARLKDGTPVVVKVQYPGIREALRSDLRNLDSVISVLSVLPGFDVDDLVENFSERLVEESDYELEAEHQQQFARLWSDEDRVVIPRVFPEVSGSRVLVSERHEGRSFQQILRDKERARSDYGEVLFWFVFRSLLGHRIFNADPHPGNYLFLDGGRVVFLDFGSVQTYDAEDLDHLTELRDALLDGLRGEDLYEILAYTFRVDLEPDDPYWEIAERFILYAFEPVLADQPYKFTRSYTEKLAQITIDSKKKMASRFLLKGVPVPRMRGWLFFNRILFGLNSILATMRARRDWRRLIVEASE